MKCEPSLALRCATRFASSRKSADAAKAQEVTAAEPETDPLAGVRPGPLARCDIPPGQNADRDHQRSNVPPGPAPVSASDDGTRSLALSRPECSGAASHAHEHITQSYELGYPDKLGNRPSDRHARRRGSSVDGSIAEIDPEGELAFYKKLLNSPLGKLGKGLTGNPGARGPASGAGMSKRGVRVRNGGPPSAL